MKLPTIVSIEFLHRRYAGDEAAFELIYTHCKIVWAIAEQLIEKNNLQVDAGLVKVGALLHDIGVYRLRPDEVYIRHGILGYETLKDESLDEIICRFASHHTGVGLTKTEIETRNLPLPAEDFLAETAEERLVMYADKFHSKSEPPHFNSLESYRETAAQFGARNVEAFDRLVKEFGEPDLEALSTQFGHKIA